MGNSLDRLGGYTSQDNEETVKTGKKRKSNESPAGSPVKLTKLDTTKYVYEKLFLQGESSDIKIHALGKTWNLHKLYLQQCSFFEVLFGGAWKDSQNNEFTLNIPDSRVTINGLHAIFASLYNNEIEYCIDNILGIVAAASFFKLDSVLARCDEELPLHISKENVVSVLNMATMYGLKNLQTVCMQTLKVNFWRFMKDSQFLQELEKDDLITLLSSPDLLVIEGEVDLYIMVKRWIYLKNNEDISMDEETLTKKMKEFFSKQEDNSLFIENSTLFATLRLHHLVTSSACIAEVEDDRLIPKEILRGIMVDQWKTTITNEENPSSAASLSDEGFYLNCFRGGRSIDSSPRCWRWVGFNNGMDLILNYNRGIITLKRNCFHTATPYSVNLKSERTVHYRLVVCDSNGKYFFDSGKKEVTLHLDQSIVVCRLPDDLSLPISVHLFYLTAQPPPPTFLYINQYIKIKMNQSK